MLFGEQGVMLLIKENYLVKHIQSNRADSLYIDCPYIEQTLSLKSFDAFMFCGHYLLFTTLFGLINFSAVSQNYLQPLRILECSTSILLLHVKHKTNNKNTDLCETKT